MSFRLRQLTARGSGGVSVLALEGSAALERLRRLVPGCVPELGRPQLVRLRAAEEDLDLALVVARPDGVLELHVTGSPPLVTRLSALLAPEAGLDAPKTVEELARSQLASAPCEAAARILLDASEGRWRAEVAALAELEPATSARRATELAERGRIAARCLVPTRMVLAGPVNAGKSTLFNALAGESRAIVSAEAGTTRDVLTARVLLGAYPVLVHDAAGERPLPESRAPQVELERAGQELARAARSAGELVLWLEPADSPADTKVRSTPPSQAVRVVSKADLAARARGGIALAAGPEPAGAVARVTELFRECFDLPLEPWRPGVACPFTAAQRAALARLGGSDLTVAARAELLVALLAV